MWEYNNTEELYHYGILGMKWGHRKARYPKSEDRIRYEELKKKSVSQLSTKELNELNNRMQAENNYKRNKKDRSVFNKAVKIAVATGLTVEGLYKTYGMLKRVSKDSKPIVDKIKQKTKSIKHSDIKNCDDFKKYVKSVSNNNKDYLMHYGVLGMKWKNHAYKFKENSKRKLKDYVIAKKLKVGNTKLIRNINNKAFKNGLVRLKNVDDFSKGDVMGTFKLTNKGKKVAIGTATAATAAATAAAILAYEKHKKNKNNKNNNKNDANKNKNK